VAVPVTAAHATPTWRYYADTGDPMSAIGAAETAGFAALVGSMPQTDVLLLGDTADQAHKPGRAAEAYAAVRTRFPGSPAAIDAALKLGHLAEVGHDNAGAARWFERALREAPNAPTAPEAMGRWLEVLSHGKAGAARAVAQEYLRRFPNGQEAALAHELTR
jgi:TolA-binding protein